MSKAYNQLLIRPDCVHAMILSMAAKDTTFRPGLLSSTLLAPPTVSIVTK